MAALVVSYSQTLPGQVGWMLKLFCSAEIEAVAIERISEYIALEAECDLHVERADDFAADAGSQATIKQRKGAPRFSSSPLASSNAIADKEISLTSFARSGGEREGGGSGAIVFDSVTLSYSAGNEGANDDAAAILKGLNLRISPGQRSTRKCWILCLLIIFASLSISCVRSLPSLPPPSLSLSLFTVRIPPLHLHVLCLEGEKVAICGRTGAGE